MTHRLLGLLCRGNRSFYNVYLLVVLNNRPNLMYLRILSGFKVRREIKELIGKSRDRINWSDELRRFVEEKVRELEAEENFKNIIDALSNARWRVPKDFSVSTIREDRDCN